MKQIEIDFESYYDKWITSIHNGLKSRDIVFESTLPLTICNSLKYAVNNFLIHNNFKPVDKYIYRQNLSKRLKVVGLKLEIVSNDLLWKYLEYFTDLDDYSQCFSIQLIVYDADKAEKYNTYKRYGTRISESVFISKEFFSRDLDYCVIYDKLQELKNLKHTSVSSNEKIDILINVIELILDKLERRLDDEKE